MSTPINTHDATGDEMKSCYTCGLLKPVGDYYKSRSGNPVRDCKGCIAERGRSYRKKNAVALKERQKQYYQRTRPARLSYIKNWVAENPGKSRKYKADYQRRNPIKKKEYARKRAKRPEVRSRIKASYKKWQECAVTTATDSYIKLLLTSKSSLSRSSIPQSLVEAKRAELQLKRHLRNHPQHNQPHEETTEHH